jgi:predicted nucleic acid-binding protein
MARPAADRAILDTNVLLAATDQGRPEHARAMSALVDWPAGGATLYTSGQILREYIAVAARPEKSNGLGMPVETAVANVRVLRERLRFLEENEKVYDRLQKLLGAVTCSGSKVHDANVVATMLVHGVEAVVTSNIGDFTRFGTHIEVVAL